MFSLAHFSRLSQVLHIWKKNLWNLMNNNLEKNLSNLMNNNLEKDLMKSYE